MIFLDDSSFTTPIGTGETIHHLINRSYVPLLRGSLCNALHCDSLALIDHITMQSTDSQHTADIAACSSGNASETSPLETPSPCASTAPPVHVLGFPERNCINGRQPRSEVWLHFLKADDYLTSKKATCMHCNKTLTSHRGSTSTMHLHLEKNHPSVLSTGAEPPDR